MKRVLSLLTGTLLLSFLGLAGAAAQDRVAVTFKVFPPVYEVFSGGDRLPYADRGEYRSYLLPAGSVRVNLTAPGAAPLALGLEVKPGMAAVQAKLEPRQGPLQLVDEAATGKAPRNLAFTADGKKLLVALQGEPGVEVFEIPSLKRLARMDPPAPGASGFTDVLAVGKEIWAVQKDGRIHLFDGATQAFKESVSVARSGNATLTDLGGGKLALANWDDSVVTILDAAVRKPLATVALPGSLRGLAFGKGIGYASLFDRGQLAVIDPATWKVKAQWPAGKAPRPVAAAGSSLFVGDMGSAQVLVLDLGGKVVKTVPVPSNPHQMVVSADHSMVAVASRGRNNPDDYQLPGPDFGRVTLLSAQGEVLGTVWGRNQPTGLAFSPDGKFLAFTDFLDNNVELYRISR